jgi:hypothetical protein
MERTGEQASGALLMEDSMAVSTGSRGLLKQLLGCCHAAQHVLQLFKQRSLLQESGSGSPTC